MARVEVEFEEVDDMENERGYPQEGVVATCGQCDHQVQSFGTTERSRKRCLMLLRDECPEGQSNFYVDAAEE